MCGGLQFQPDGTYTFNGVVSAQGSIELTSPSVGGSVVLVRTYTVWRNGDAQRDPWNRSKRSVTRPRAWGDQGRGGGFEQLSRASSISSY